MKNPLLIVLFGSLICIEGLSPSVANAVGSSANKNGRLSRNSSMSRRPLNQQGDIGPNVLARRRGERRRCAESGILSLLLSATVAPSLLFAPLRASAAPFHEVAPNYSIDFRRRLSETEEFKSLRREPVLSRAVREVRDLQDLQDSRLDKCADR